MNALTLKHQLLIAMPQMGDPNFEQTVTYVVEHSEEGAMGLTLNRPVTISLADILADMEINIEVPPSASHRVVAGGPVQQEAGFVMHPASTQWQSSLPLGHGLALTTSRDILEALAIGEGPEQSLICLGYAGWGAGQLEQELADNAWLVAPASRALILDTPFEQCWHDAANSLGVDIHLLTQQPGHS